MEVLADFEGSGITGGDDRVNYVNTDRLALMCFCLWSEVLHMCIIKPQCFSNAF